MGPSGQDEWLQRLFDGDLDAEARAAAEERLAQDPEAQKELRSLTRLSALMSASFEEQARGLDSDALFARITAEIDAPAADEAPVPRPEARESWWRRLIRSGVVMPVGGAVALAAAVLLTFFPPTGDGTHDGSAKSAAGDGPSALSVASATEIVAVDFGGSTGTVFEIALKDGASTPVVWINDEE